jgi:lipopolysaccharide/colanic/teichoic acid biosynthesis glycosyltransferase
MKRAFDVVVAGAGLVVFAPVAALVAMAIRLEDGGPVLFAQERVGLEGRVFKALKFRSMIPDAERHTGAVQAQTGTTRGSRASAACCGRPRWTNCRNSGTSSAAT